MIAIRLTTLRSLFITDHIRPYHHHITVVWLVATSDERHQYDDGTYMIDR
jgi:hypothetical protein